MIWKVFPYMLTQVSNSLKSQIKVFPYVFTQVRVRGLLLSYQMVHQVITNVVCWSVIGLLKEFVFLTVAVSVLAVFGALTVYQRCCVPGENKDVEANPVDDIESEGFNGRSGNELCQSNWSLQ